MFDSGRLLRRRRGRNHRWNHRPRRGTSCTFNSKPRHGPSTHFQSYLLNSTCSRLDHIVHRHMHVGLCSLYKVSLSTWIQQDDARPVIHLLFCMFDFDLQNSWYFGLYVLYCKWWNCPRLLTLLGLCELFEFYCHVILFVFVLQLVCGYYSTTPQYHVCVIHNIFTTWMNISIEHPPSASLDP